MCAEPADLCIMGSTSCSSAAAPDWKIDDPTSPLPMATVISGTSRSAMLCLMSPPQAAGIPSSPAPGLQCITPCMPSRDAPCPVLLQAPWLSRSPVPLAPVGPTSRPPHRCPRAQPAASVSAAAARHIHLRHWPVIDCCLPAGIVLPPARLCSCLRWAACQRVRRAAWLCHGSEAAMCLQQACCDMLVSHASALSCPGHLSQAPPAAPALPPRLHLFLHL